MVFPLHTLAGSQEDYPMNKRKELVTLAMGVMPHLGAVMPPEGSPLRNENKMIAGTVAHRATVHASRVELFKGIAVDKVGVVAPPIPVASLHHRRQKISKFKFGVGSLREQ